MERVPKENRETAKRATQRKSATHTAQSDTYSFMNNSPMMVSQRKKFQSLFDGAVQLKGAEEDPLQGQFNAVQRAGEEELLQKKHNLGEEEFLPGKFGAAQRVEDEEPLQGKFEAAQRVEDDEPIQGKFTPDPHVQPEQQPASQPNNTGLPDNLKSGIENLSGMSMDNVKVRYNSSQPAQLNALAYAQGTDIHVAPGQEQHLPHEAWHVVQQAQGRVQPTTQMKGGVPVNDDKGLEHEADVMGQRALSSMNGKASHGASQFFGENVQDSRQHLNYPNSTSNANMVQRELDDKDLERIIQNLGDDELLTQIVSELFEIYHEYKDKINYGKSSQGGAVGFQDYAPFITIIKDKNFWSEDKTKRESTILHELMHLAEVKAYKGTLALHPKDEIDNYENLDKGNQFGQESLKMVEWMTPQLDYTGKIGGWLDEIKKGNVKWLINSGADSTQQTYITDRLKYALLKQHEQPTTMIDLYYYMKAMGFTKCQLYEEIQSASNDFFRARKAVRSGYRLLKDN